MSLAHNAKVIEQADERWDEAFAALAAKLTGKPCLAFLYELEAARNDAEGARLDFFSDLRRSGVSQRRAYHLARGI